MFGIKYAFMPLVQYEDEEEAYIRSLREAKETTFDISEDGMFDRGNAYFYARTGSKVDLDGKEYTVTTDEEGNHRIGYSDTIYLKDADGNVTTVSKAEFIEKATLLKEEAKPEEYGVWQNVEASKYKSGDLAVGFVAKGMSKEEAEAKAKELSDKYCKFGACTYEVRKVDESLAESAIVEEPIKLLEPKFDSRKSFYKKAKVDEREDGTKILWSYNTPVCKIKDGKATLLKRGYLGWFSSPTTLRHVKDFLQQNGFKIGSKSELAKMYETERYDESLITEADAMKANLDDEKEVGEAKEILTKEHDEEVEQIVDVDANTVAELKDSYVGNVILQCPVCRTLLYKKPDAIEKAEDSDIYNVGEACLHCGSEDGYGLVGQVAELSVKPEVEDDSTTGKETDSPDVEPDKEGTESEDEVGVEVEETEKVGEPVVEESLAKPAEADEFDDASFNALVTDFLTETYNNVTGFTANEVTKEGSDITVSGSIAYASGKERSTEFKLKESVEGGSISWEGSNPTFAGGSFRFDVVSEGNVAKAKALSYEIEAKSVNESYKVKGRISRA